VAKTISVPPPQDGPKWRGVSELSGEYGDILHGTYRRSPNNQIVNGGAMGKRRGFIRALDEQFVGWPSAVYARDGSLLVYAVVDGAGVKLLTSLPASTFDTISADHGGFMSDTFTRADAAGVQTGTTLPWIEGQDSLQNSALTENDSLRIVSNALALRRSDAAVAGVDWATAAPTPFYSQRVEVNFGDFVKNSASSYAEVVVAIGMPGPVYDQIPTRNHEQVYMADAYRTAFSGGNTAWSGLVARLRVKVSDNATPKYQLEAELAELGSTVEQSARTTRSGGVARTATKTSAEIAVAGNILTTWVFEFGREQVGAVWVPRMDIWRSKNIADLEAGTQGDKFMFLTLDPGMLDQQVGGFFLNLPHDGTGGLSAVRMATLSDNTSVHSVPKVKAALSFATRRGAD
jgi:hypothetical protein